MKSNDQMLRLEAIRLSCTTGKPDLKLAQEIYEFLRAGEKPVPKSGSR